MHISIINGPNLNLLGKREPEIYGNSSFESYFNKLKQNFPDINIKYFQSNIEGELIDFLHKEGFNHDGIIINPGGYAHTSVALADAISAIPAPVAEVHISNVHAREVFRHKLITGAKANIVISGAGLTGYKLAIQYLTEA